MKFRMVLVSLALLSYVQHASAEPLEDCIAALASDYALQPIADKVALGGRSDRSFSMMANDNFPTPSEKPAIYNWGSKRDRCLSDNPPQQNPATSINFEGFRAVQSIILDLYRSNISYGEFNRRRQDINNATTAKIQRLVSQYQQQQQSQYQYQQQREDYLDQACLNRARNQIERANCSIEKGGRQIGGALFR